jgi:hypothetical protein
MVDGEVDAVTRIALERGSHYQLESEYEICRFAELLLELGAAFDEWPEARAELLNPDLDADDRLDAVLALYPNLPATVSDRPEDAADKSVASRITKVTMYSDRALVSREATVPLTIEPTIYRFKKLPGWVDEGSGGVTGASYVVLVTAATEAGRIKEVEFTIRVRD